MRSNGTSSGCRPTATSTESRSRPHIKTHKLPELARLQVKAGAVGITCQKLGEAEVMADAGFDDILLSFPLVGAAKAERLAALAERVKMTVVGDSAEVALGLAPVLARHVLEVDFLVECDTGLGRTGVQSPQEAAELAELVDGLPGLRFAGLMTYPSLPETAEWLLAARDAVEARGLSVGRVSGGGTPTADAHPRARRRRRAPRRAPTSTATAPASPTARCRSRTARCGSSRRSSAGRRANGRSSTPARRR